LLAAVLDVALVGTVISSVSSSYGVALPLPEMVVSTVAIVGIGLIVLAWPPILWPIAVSGVLALGVVLALATASTSSASVWGAGIGGVLFGGALSMRGADLAGLFAGEVQDGRRTIPSATLIALAVVAVLVLGPLLLGSAMTWPTITRDDESARQQIMLGATVVWLVARGAISIGVASRLVGALATDRYLPASLALEVSGRPRRQAIVAVAAIAGIASFVGEVALLGALGAVWVGSLVLLVASLVVIRIGHPRLRRGFVIPGGVQAVALCGAVAITVGASVVVEGLGSGGLAWMVAGAVCLATGPIAWVALTIAVKRGRANLPVPIEFATRWFDAARPGTPELTALEGVPEPFEERLALVVPSDQGGVLR
jgi:hypothetical protein